MSTIVAIVVVATAVGIGWAIYRKVKDSSDSEQVEEQTSQKALPDNLAGRHPTDLQLNDIVSHFGTDYVVEGRIDYEEGGYRWYEFMLVDGDDARWLCVEEDDQLEVTLWQEIDDLMVDPPVPETLEYEGEEYRMIERGEARAVQKGKTGRKKHPEVKYWDFSGSGDSYLSVEEWGGEIEVSKGTEVNLETLDVFPGDEVGTSSTVGV
ncbi:MAG: DUF4178 domain-containing protein [Bradymonadaceae bacterium]